MRITRLGFIGLVVLFCLGIASGENIDLSTVPKRDSVQLTIYNSQDLTLVRETRTVTFKKGANPLQFSWANTLIDPTSVQLKFLTQPDKLEVLDTTYPHDKPQMLYWNVNSEIDGEATIQIIYFTSGITWKADYTCIADAGETQMGFEGFVRIYNNSGEQYENAQIRLVVGTINLVEKIAGLAGVQVSKLSRDLPVLKQAIEDDEKEMAQADKDADELQSRPKEIIKQGLSEYFIYTIEGTETIENGWSKRIRSFEGMTVPFKIQYRYRPAEYGDQLVRMYLLTNDKDSKLGTTPLPDGVVRVFRNNGRGGLSYLTAQTVKYIPIGDKIELNLGPDPNVIFELIKQRCFRDNIWMQLNGADVYRRVGDAAVRINVNSSVAGWDDHQVFSQRIRNYTGKLIDVQIRRSFDGDITFRGKLGQVLFDYRTAEFTASIEAGTKKDLTYEVVARQGHNAKQNNVTLETGEVTP